MPPTHRVCLLGPVLIQRGSQPLTGIKSRKALTLLGYLAMHSGAVARTHLASLIWENLPEDRARANLSWTVHYLASILPGNLEITRHSVGFCPNSYIRLDVDAFRQLATQGDIGSLAQAASLYRGAFLEGIELAGCEEFELWLLGEREHWRLRAVNVLYRLAHFYEQACDTSAAAETLWRLLEVEPWAEHAHFRLMHIYAITGLTADALAQYQRYCQIARSELDAEPGAAITALYECIRQGMYGGGDLQSELDMNT